MKIYRPTFLLTWCAVCAAGDLGRCEDAAPPMLGIIQAFEEVVLSSPVDELVAETPFKEGETVKKGEVVLRLRDAEQQVELKRSASMLRKAEFDAAASRELVKEKIVAEDKGLEQEVRLELAKLECESARIKAEERSLRTPISGVVTKRIKEKGESVGRMEPVMEVMEIDRVFVMLNLPEGVRAKLRQNAPAEVRVVSAKEGATFMGKIDFIDPVVNPGSGLFRVKILVVNPEGLLRPGMRAEVRFPAVIEPDVETQTPQDTSGGVPKDSSNR